MKYSRQVESLHSIVEVLHFIQNVQRNTMRLQTDVEFMAMCAFKGDELEWYCSHPCSKWNIICSHLTST